MVEMDGSLKTQPVQLTLFLDKINQSELNSL